MEILENLVLQVFKGHLDLLDSQDNKEYLVCQVILDLLEDKEILVHLVVMEQME